MTNARISDANITVNVEVFMSDKDKDKIPEFETEQEHVEKIARDKVSDRFGRLRGDKTIIMQKVEEQDTQDVWEGIVSSSGGW